MESDNRVEINAATGVVRFRTVNKADEGIYVCVASNNVGNASATGFIKVLGMYCQLWIKLCHSSASAVLNEVDSRWKL